MCCGKALKWAALPLLCLGLFTPQVLSAAVHRAKDVDVVTARLLGGGTPESDHGAPEISQPSDVGKFFSSEGWRPVSPSSWREPSSRSSSSLTSSGEPITEEMLMTGPRQMWPQPRAEGILEVVITPKPIRVPGPTKLKGVGVAEPVEESRGPEVEDSIAALTSQLLSSNHEVLDVRTPPIVKQATSKPATGKPVKDEGTWSLISTMQLKDKVVTKVPPVSITSTTPTTTTVAGEGISTRFPPRKPPPEFPTKSQFAVRNPSTETPATKRPVVEITTKKVTPVPTTPKPEIEMTKKPFTAVTQSSKKTPAPISLTVMMRRNATLMTTTTKQPIMAITERIPTTASRVTVGTTTPKPDKTTVVPKLSVFPVPKPDKVVATLPKITEVQKPQRPLLTSVKISQSSITATKAPISNVKLTDNTNTKLGEKVGTLITERPVPVSFEKISFTKDPALPAPLKLVDATTQKIKETSTAAIMSNEIITTVAPPSAVTKRTRRPTKKKNKNRRRRPATKTSTVKPEEALETKEGDESLTALTKPPKALSTRIYNFIARDVMPNFGMGMMGLLVTAGLAGLLLIPIEGFARRSDVNRREDEQDGLVSSIIQAVMTSLNIGEQKYEEQGPRRLRRQVDENYNEVNSNEAIPVPSNEDRPFSIVRLMKQMFAFKLDIVANMLRVASEALRNYAQNEGRRPLIGTTTEQEETEVVTEKVDLFEPSSTSQETPVLLDQTTTTTTTTSEKILDDENEESNLVRRRTNS